MANCIKQDITVHFAPISLAKTLTVEMQGKYKSENTKNDKLLGSVSENTLDDNSKLFEISCKVLCELQPLTKLIVLTMISFATKPHKRQATAP